MVRKRAELAGRQVAIPGGAWTMVQPRQLAAAGRHHLRPEPLAVATGIAEHNGYAKTFIASASREKP